MYRGDFVRLAEAVEDDGGACAGKGASDAESDTLPFKGCAAAGLRSVMARFMASDSLARCPWGHVATVWTMLARALFKKMLFG